MAERNAAASGGIRLPPLGIKGGPTDKLGWHMRDWEGREVVLLKSRWHGHIAVRHPEVARYLDRIPQALARPNLVFESDLDEGTLLFYRLGVTDGRYKNKYLTVVVRYERYVGEVLTVYVPIAPTGGIGRLIHADR